jgi:hypothetical protein
MSKFLELVAKLDRIPHIYLGRDFDVARMQAEMDAIDPALFVPYRSKSRYTKHIARHWYGLSLISPKGSIHGDLTEETYACRTDCAWTPIAESCPYMKEVIRELGGEGQRVRFMCMKAGGSLAWHRHGTEIAFENGKVVGMLRPNWYELIVHVPVRSNPEYSYEVIENQSYELGDFAAGNLDIHRKNYPDGQAWAFNGVHVHNVFNRSKTEDRYSIMLTLDVRMKKTFDMASEAVERYLANNEGPLLQRVE